MSGKTILATAVWLVAWAILHFIWRSEQVEFGKIFAVTLALIALGFLGTFPLFFRSFGV